MKLFYKILPVTLFISLHISAQDKKNVKDTLPTRTLDSVIVNTKLKTSDASYMTDVEGSRIYAGKRTNTLTLSNNITSLPMNLGRTVLAKIPGLNMWEMDGASTQLNIGSRGTDPHRSIEMNMRQNGYNTNSDMFGYPENHYTVPLQAVQEIQLVRGSGALQFGPQFGGMMNYVMKQGDNTKPFTIESEQTAGSNNFFNSYNAVGGTKARFNYYAFFDYRHGNGWRDNAKFDYHAYHIHLGYAINSRASIAVEFSRMDYVQQIAGGLTDAQFNVSASQSVRARNFFQPVINIPAAIFKYDISTNTHLEITTSGLFGERNSVQFINTANIADTFNTAIGSYNPRQVDRDYYTSFTTEARVLHNYNLGKFKNTLSAGLRYYNSLTKRKQKGVGTKGNDFDLTLVQPYGIDLRLTTNNYAVFAEDIFQVTDKFSITPGVRYEVIRTNLTGVINNATAHIAYDGDRNFPLFGTGLQYTLNSSQFYGNISQAYRPYLYANVTPADRVDKIDPTLKDSKGYNIDLGYRGHYKNILQYDLNLFYLFYGDRVGLISQSDNTGTHLFTTNIGNSVSKGAEAFVEVSIRQFKIFNSIAYNDARYKKSALNRSGVNTSVEGNFVENSPEWINKTGVSFNAKNFFTSIQYSYTSKSYNDAFNVETSANGVTGAIPAYHVWDWSFNWEFLKQYHISAGVNNFTDEKYFNRRITFYPGPGILPADGRTFYISFGIKL